MTAPVLLTATWNSTAKVLTLTWDQTVTYTAENQIVVTDDSGATWVNHDAYGVPIINGATMVVMCITTVTTAGTHGSVSVEAGVVESLGTTPNAAYANFVMTTYGGAVPTTGIPTIGTYDEYVNVYSANSNQLAAGATQAQIQAALDAANMAAVRYCGVAFTNAGNTLQTFTEKLDGNGSNIVRVRNPPITAITSVAVVGSDGSSYTLDSTAYRFHPETGTIETTVFGSALFAYTESSEFPANVSIGDATGFPAGFRNVTVVYTGGYTTAPADLRWAIYDAVDEQLSRVGIRGTKNMPTEDDLRKAVIRRLQPFMRIVC